MSEWTKEPWRVQPYVDGIDIVAEDDTVIASMVDRSVFADGMPPANAARIVACVNALEGIPTEQLASVVDENKRLREALEQLKSHYEFTISHYEANGPQWTSRETGSEYYDASFVIGDAREWLGVAQAALAGGGNGS